MKYARAIAAAAVLFAVLPLVPASAGTHRVTIPGRFFQPQSIRVTVGDMVRWTNTSDERHTVTSGSDSNEPFNSSRNCPGALLFNDCIRPGGSFSHTFETRGTFTYYCQLHGSDRSFPNCGMCGRVTVVRTQSGTVAPTAAGTPPPSTPASVSPSPSVTSPAPTVSSSRPSAAEPDRGSDEGLPILPIAGAGVLLLGVSGFLVYRTMIR